MSAAPSFGDRSPVACLALLHQMAMDNYEAVDAAAAGADKADIADLSEARDQVCAVWDAHFQATLFARPRDLRDAVGVLAVAMIYTDRLVTDDLPSGERLALAVAIENLTDLLAEEIDMSLLTKTEEQQVLTCTHRVAKRHLADWRKPAGPDSPDSGG